MKTNQSSSPLFRNTLFCAPKIALFSLLILLSSQWSSLATATASQKSPASLNASLQKSWRLGASQEVITIPGRVLAFADLDGDQIQEYVKSRHTCNAFVLFAALSSRSSVTVLNPNAQSAVFTVHVGEVNNHYIQDIIVRSPAASCALAVWLGRGNGDFEAADQNFFQNSLGFSESTAQPGNSPQVDQDPMFDPSEPVCEKKTLAFVYSDPESSEIMVEDSGFPELSNHYFSLTLRSPPNRYSF